MYDLEETKVLMHKRDHFPIAGKDDDYVRMLMDLADEVPDLIVEIERVRRERNAAEGRDLPKFWGWCGGYFSRVVREREDIRVHVFNGLGTHDCPYARITGNNIEGISIEAPTILAAMEAAEAWLKENLR